MPNAHNAPITATIVPPIIEPLIADNIILLPLHVVAIGSAYF